MKKMRNILVLTIVCLATVAATESYYANQYLFNLSADEKPLTNEQMESLTTPYPNLNRIIKKYDVVRIERWLENAKETDHDGDVYLNRIYRLVTSAAQLAPLAIADEIVNSNRAIKSAEPEAVMRNLGNIPNDPGKSNQWYLDKAGVLDAWQLWDLEGGESPGDRKIVVAVVDDGVEYTHPDLWQNIWINQDELPSIYFNLIDKDSDGFVTSTEAVDFVGDVNGDTKTDLVDVLEYNSLITDGVDNDSDGFIDNIIGWDSNNRSSTDDDDNNPMVTNNYHGTHVAGLVGARTNNGIGIASAAYNVSIMPVKSTQDASSEFINTGWNGILCAAQAGADIINCSWGGPGYNTLSQNTINTATNTYGSLIVAAAGNGDDSGNPSDEAHYPSGYKNVVSVTALSSSDEFSWANYGSPLGNFDGVDISAPGENMYSTYYTRAGEYTYLRGTSMASPFVASCFALLKSVYPDSSNTWLIRRMLTNTDNIDDKNPDYIGKLGRGRVNILKALASDKWPSLSVKSQEELISSGDGDLVLNPGETVNILVELQNEIGWSQANQVKAILTTEEENVTILDSISTWANIQADSSVLNDNDGFTIQFSSLAKIKTYDFKIKLISNEDSGTPYRATLPFYVDTYLNMEGFPFKTKTEVEAGALSADVNGNGKQEIIFIDKSGDLYIVDISGDTLPNFPISLGSEPGGIAMADIDLDDTLEIVTTLFEKNIQVYDVTGKFEWKRSTDFFITGMPAIGNLDDDLELEIVFGSYDKNIYALNHDSTDVANFPYNSGQLLHAGPALADIDNDGYDDIIMASKGGECFILNSDAVFFDGWPVTGLGSIVSEPQVIKGNDGSAVILIGNESGKMYGINTDGTQRFMVDGRGSVKASPALYVNNNDAFAFFATSVGEIYKIDLNNDVLVEGWPKTIPSQIYRSLVISDLELNSIQTPSVISLANDGNLYAIDIDGNSVGDLFPLNTRMLSQSSPLLADLDYDGDLEIVTGSNTGITVQDLKNDIGTIYWPMHRGSVLRQGSVEHLLTSVSDENQLSEGSFELLGNYPNPFNPTTLIRFNLPVSSNVELKIYSLSGKEIYHQNYTALNAGINEFSIDMDNFASGVYFYSLIANETIRTAKMILMK